MARRKDHTPQQLRQLVITAAHDLIVAHGLTALTARRLAARIGYTPGTLYNIFPDMDAVALAVHGVTLVEMQNYFARRIAPHPPGFARISALAHAYGEFAAASPRRWLALFAQPRTGRLPEWYRRQLRQLFAFIESHLQESLGQTAAESRRTARYLWACLHGIATLTLDGRLNAIGGSEAKPLIDTLLKPYSGGRPGR